ncbi:MAG: hypothetical protein OHK0052_12390 [Anaerolineales bacterium]
MSNFPSWIGRQLKNRYQIEALLGQGGMSAVYKAFDPNLKRPVAIKLIHAHLSDSPEFLRRFETEAAAVAQLRHPNIIQVYDFDHDEQTYFMVLEYIEGHTLQHRLRQLTERGQRMSAAQVVEIASQIGEAIDYAHQCGIIHRDIKPANIMLNEHGQAVLMDFGIVRMVGEQHYTATGALVGTALYMSPEQIRGEAVDARSDIYSLGVVLFEMLGGRPPFEGNSAITVMRRHMEEPIPDLLRLAPDVPPALKAVVERALAKDPAQRYASAGDLASDLRRSLQAPAPVAPVSAPAKTNLAEEATVKDLPRVTLPKEPAPIPQTGVRPRPQPAISAAPAPKKKGLSCWVIGVGALALLLCVILPLGIGGLALLNGGDAQPTQATAENFDVAVSIQPSTVQSGATFEVRVTVRNTTSSVQRIQAVALPVEIKNAAEIVSVAPAATGSQGNKILFDLPLNANSSEQIIVTLRAKTNGDFVGTVEVQVSGATEAASARVVVAAGGSNPTQAPVSVTQAAAPTLPASGTLGTIPYQAVVQITAMYRDGGNLYEGWTGSGSIVTPDGIILTNAHVVLSDKYFTVAALKIALTTAEDQPPRPTYYAEVMQADAALDIAVIRVTTDLNGNPVDRANLNLPVVPLGNSDSLRLGDALTILGYPGIGGNTITLTRGEVSGFTAESGRGDRAFIKTSATIAGGNSGGLAANERGELIGVPTQLGYGGDDQYVDCRVLADTNRDGIVDDRDNCVPTGGFINALRPITLARPYIEAAMRGEYNVQAAAQPANVPPADIPSPTSGTTLFSDAFTPGQSDWSTTTNENGGRTYKDGQYQIEVLRDNYYLWSSYDFGYDGDMIVEVAARVAKSTGESDYGILCRYQDKDNFYAFEISEDGYYTIWEAVAGEYYTLLDWTYSGMDFGDWTKITASCVGNQLILAVNGTPVAQVTDDSHTYGNIGLIAGTWDEPGLVVAFDNLIVYEP